MRPIVASIHAPSRYISTFLDELLSPFFNQVARTTTFTNGIDLVRALEKYRDNDFLLPSTLFITFDVTDLYTMMSREGALAALARLCAQHSNSGKTDNISVDTLLRLARIVLDINTFAYDDKYYQQIKGDAMGSPFTMVLAHIYMLEWETSLIINQTSQNELYSR